MFHTPIFGLSSWVIKQNSTGHMPAPAHIRSHFDSSHFFLAEGAIAHNSAIIDAKRRSAKRRCCCT